MLWAVKWALDGITVHAKTIGHLMEYMYNGTLLKDTSVGRHLPSQLKDTLAAKVLLVYIEGVLYMYFRACHCVTCLLSCI